MLTGASFAQVYLEIVKAAIEKKELRDGTAFKMMPFECSSNGLPPLALLPLPLEPRHLTLHPTRWHPGMHGNYQWTKLQARLETRPASPCARACMHMHTHSRMHS